MRSTSTLLVLAAAAEAGAGAGGAAVGTSRVLWRAAASAARPSPPRSGHTACADPDGRVWLFGGYAEPADGGERAPTNDLWCLEPEGEWQLVQPATPTPDASRPGPRLCSACAVLPGARELLLFGGWDPTPAGSGGSFYDDVWALSLDDGSWTRLDRPMPRGPTSRHVACAVGSELIVHTFRCERSVLRWDRAANALVEQPTSGEAPPSLGLHAAAGVGDSLVVFGGANKAGEMCSDAYVLDTRTWKWARVPGSGPSARAGACAAALDGERMVLFGGAERAPGGAGLLPRDDAWLLRVPADAPAQWEPLAPHDAKPPPARNAATLVHAGDGRLVLHGGWQPFVRTYDDTHVLELE